MKKSPLQLDAPQYAVVEVRAHPHFDEALLAKELPISVRCGVTYEVDGDHFAMVTISQENKEYAYTFEIQAFTTFRINVEVAKESYKKAFNPAVVACNVARILYSGARELLATVSSRAPHGVALLPSILIEPSDIELDFEEGRHEDILVSYFSFGKEQLAALEKAVKARAKTRELGSTRKSTGKTSAAKKK